MPEQVKNKCAIVVSEELPAGLAANASSVLSVTLGQLTPLEEWAVETERYPIRTRTTVPTRNR